MIEKGRPWERPASGPADVHVDGDDRTLAEAVRDHPGARVGFRPDRASDLARALGLHALDDVGLELVLDALHVVADDRDLFSVNMVVVGTPPDRTTWRTRARSVRVTVDGRAVHDAPATGVVVASGQYLRGNDVVPRGHPGDGRAEVQVYAVARGQRAAVRKRIRLGVHLPHPDITQTSGRRVEVIGQNGLLALEIDGVATGAARQVAVDLVPQAFLIVI